MLENVAQSSYQYELFQEDETLKIEGLMDIINLYFNYHYDDELEGGKTRRAIGYVFINVNLGLAQIG